MKTLIRLHHADVTLTSGCRKVMKTTRIYMQTCHKHAVFIKTSYLYREWEMLASDPEGLLFSTEDLNIVKMNAFYKQDLKKRCYCCFLCVCTCGKLPSSTTVLNSWSISSAMKSSTSYCCRSADTHRHTEMLTQHEKCCCLIKRGSAPHFYS